MSKEEGLTMQDVIGDFVSGQKGMARLQDEGLVRATARQILINDIKAGKINHQPLPINHQQFKQVSSFNHQENHHHSSIYSPT